MNKVSQWVTAMASETPGSTLSLVGQGSILDKSSLHTVGCLGKNVDLSAAPEGGYCPVCEAKGQLQALRTYRINFTQSIYLCANPQCIYPLGYTPLDNIIANTADLKKHHSPGKPKKRHILDTSVTINSAKKRKTDSFISGEYILESLSSSPQIESYKSVFPCVPKESESALWDFSKQPGHLQHGFNEFRKGTVHNQVMGMTAASMNSPSPLKLNVPATKDLYTPSQPVIAIYEPQTCINQKSEAGIAGVLNGYPKADADMGCSLSLLSTCAPLCDPGLRSNLTLGHKPSDIPSSSYSDVCLKKTALEAPLLVDAALSDNNNSLHSEPAEKEDCENKISYGSSLLNGEIISDSCKKLNKLIHSSPQSVENLVTDMSDSNLCNDIDLKDGSKISLEETTAPSCSQPEQIVLNSHPISDPAVTCPIRDTGPEVLVEESSPISKELNMSNARPDLNPMKGLDDMSQNNVLADLSNSLSSETCNKEEASDLEPNSSSLSNEKRSPLNHKMSSLTHSEPQATASTILVSFSSALESSDSINQEKAPVTIFAHPEQSKLYSHEASKTTVSPCLSHSAEEALHISDTPGMGCIPVCEEPAVVQDMSNVNPLRASLDTTLGNSDVEREKQNESLDRSTMLTDDSIKDPKDGEVVSSLPNGSLENVCLNVKSNCSSSSIHEALNDALPNHSGDHGSQDDLCEKRLLQWKNTLFLCWLDCILSALVHSANLNSIVAQHESAGNSLIHHLLEKYKEANALIQRTGKQGPPNNMSLAENILNKVRMTIFDAIKPSLKCVLGDKESPVFALPLLLQRDPEIESCFVHSGVWKFTCKLCGYQYQNKCKQTVTTFTKILPEWTPLNAVHRSPCNNCLDTDQRRTFCIEKIHDIFIIHFVEGLPSNDLGMYSFQFDGYLYEVRTVIKYREDHFSCWIAKEDGTWLESDDMKGYFCIKQNSFAVPASEMHVVMWERKATNAAGANSTMAPETENKVLNSLSASPVSLSQTLHQSAPNAAPSLLKQTSDASNILSGMESYRDDDIITLTLIEIPIDTSGNVIDNSEAGQQQPIVFEEQLQPPLSSLVSQSASAYISTACGQRDQNPCSGTMQANCSAGVLSPALSGPSLPALSGPSLPALSGPSLPAPSGPSLPAPSGPSLPAPSGPSLPANSSTPIPNSSRSKKAFIGSWMKSLQNKNPLFLPSNVPSAKKKTPPIPGPLLKTTDLQASNKQAQCFDGFKVKHVSNSVNLNNYLGVGPTKDNSATPKTVVSSQIFQPLGSNRLKNGQMGLGNTKNLAKNSSRSNEDKVLRLRLKLLKKLKAKKNELTTLHKLGKSQAGRDWSSHPLELSSARRREQLRGYLQELQDQIDNADTESVCTMSSSTSLCSSPGDVEFFADLFSPPPANTAQDSMDDSRFLEMYVEGYNPSCADYGTNNPASKKALPSTISISQLNPQHTNSHNSSSVGNIFQDMLSTSTMQMLNEEYFSHFDDMF